MTLLIKPHFYNQEKFHRPYMIFSVSPRAILLSKSEPGSSSSSELQYVIAANKYNKNSLNGLSKEVSELKSKVSLAVVNCNQEYGIFLSSLSFTAATSLWRLTMSLLCGMWVIERTVKWLEELVMLCLGSMMTCILFHVNSSTKCAGKLASKSG